MTGFTLKMSKKKTSEEPVLQGNEAWKYRLSKGEVVTFGGKGNSMVPRIKSGEKCTYVAILTEEEAPAGARRLSRADLKPDLEGPCYIPPSELRDKDMIWCNVGRWHFTHLLTGISSDGMYQISNNHGHVNGKVPASKLYGLVIKVGNR